MAPPAVNSNFWRGLPVVQSGTDRLMPMPGRPLPDEVMQVRPSLWLVMVEAAWAEPRPSKTNRPSRNRIRGFMVRSPKNAVEG